MLRRLKIATEDIPQANSLSSLRGVVQAVAAGATTTPEIENASGLAPRHVRYYLLAAKVLGWVKLGAGAPIVSPAGKRLLTLKAGSLEEADAIAAAIHDSAVLEASVGHFLQDEQIDREVLAGRLVASTALSPSTAWRRASCLVAWRSQLLERGWRPERMQLAMAYDSNELPIDGLSVRATGVLGRLGIRRVSDLSRLTVETLLATRNCGRRTVREIMDWLKAFRPGGDVSVPSGHSAITDVDSLPVELLLKVSNFNLSARARRCLEMLGIERVGDLVTKSEADLLCGKNCGRKTVSEIESAIGALGLSLKMDVPVWAEVDADELAKRHMQELTRLRRRLRKQLFAVDSSAGVETEIASAIAGAVKAKAQPIVELWLGLDQSVAPTLHQVAEAAGLTRERIRQVVDRNKRKLWAANLDMLKLRAALLRLERSPVLSEHAAIELLVSEGLVEGSATGRGLLRAAELFGITTKLECERVKGATFLGDAEGLAALPTIRRVGRRAAEKWGCSTLEDVAAEVARETRQTMTAEPVRDALLTEPGFRWLDEVSGWFWLEDVRRNRLLNKVDKILAVAPRVDLAALRAGIARHYRMEGFSPPTRVLKALCEQLEDCEVIGGCIVVDKRPRKVEEELSEHEQALLEVFRQHGPVLSYAEAVQRCTDAGLNETTTTMSLCNSPIVRRVAMGVYAMVGAAVSPGEVEAVAKTVTRGRRATVMQDYGWEQDGSGVWASYKISEGMLRNGVAGLPAGIRKYLTAESYELQGGDGSRVGRLGTKDGSMWGLSPFFRRRGGDVGDYLRVTINLAAGTATVVISEDTLGDE